MGNTRPLDGESSSLDRTVYASQLTQDERWHSRRRSSDSFRSQLHDDDRFKPATSRGESVAQASDKKSSIGVYEEKPGRVFNLYTPTPNLHQAALQSVMHPDHLHSQVDETSREWLDAPHGLEAHMKHLAARLESLSTTRSSLNVKRINTQFARQILRTKLATFTRVCDQLVSLLSDASSSVPPELQQQLIASLGDLRRSRTSFEKTENDFNQLENDLELEECQVVEDERLLHYMIDDMPTMKLPSDPAKSSSVEDIDPVLMTEDVASSASAYSYERQYGVARRVGELPSTLPLDLSTGSVEQGPIPNGPFPTIIDGVDNRFLLVHDEDIRKGGPLGALLLDFSDTQDRINRWLLHRLRVSPTEVSIFNQIVSEECGGAQVPASLDPLFVLEFWNQDKGASERMYSRAFTESLEIRHSMEAVEDTGAGNALSSSLVSGVLGSTNTSVTERLREHGGDELVNEKLRKAPLAEQFREYAFFEVGKVFEVRWTETDPVHSDDDDDQDDQLDYDPVFDHLLDLANRSESPVMPRPANTDDPYSKHLFVVVKRHDDIDDGFQCVPIETDENEAAQHHELENPEIAFVYIGSSPETRQTDSSSKTGESMRPSIRVKPRRDWQTLYPSAKINFGRSITINYGIEAGDFGDVAEEDLPSLWESFNSVWEE